MSKIDLRGVLSSGRILPSVDIARHAVVRSELLLLMIISCLFPLPDMSGRRYSMRLSSASRRSRPWTSIFTQAMATCCISVMVMFQLRTLLVLNGLPPVRSTPPGQRACGKTSFDSCSRITACVIYTEYVNTRVTAISAVVRIAACKSSCLLRVRSQCSCNHTILLRCRYNVHLVLLAQSSECRPLHQTSPPRHHYWSTLMISISYKTTGLSGSFRLSKRSGYLSSARG